jgi:homoserine O-succinyltransferase
MPVSLDRRHAAAPDFRERDANCIHIGLVNNMTGSALQATERQFCTLLDAAAGDIVVRLSLYALPEIPRPVECVRRIDNFYSSLDGLWKTRLDGLIVTGAEPLAPLRDEPWWGSLTTLVEWAERNTWASIWSCLAAQAAVAWIDGIERRPFAEKRFGIFESSKAADNLLTVMLGTGIPDRMKSPHSRWNGIPNDALKACGYHALTRLDDEGADAFVKQRKSLFVFFQGHPEYDADTLLLEYRREVRRFLRRERDTYPRVPDGYLDERAADLLTAMRERALADRREELLEDFPFTRLAAGLTNVWRPAAVAFYRNWLRYLCARKSAHKASQKKAPLFSADTIPGSLLRTFGNGGQRADRDR